MNTRYTVRNLENVTGAFPEAQALIISVEQVADSQPEFWTATILDQDTDQVIAAPVNVIISRDPLNGDWIGIARAGVYEWAEEAFFDSITNAIDVYLNDFAAFAACK